MTPRMRDAGDAAVDVDALRPLEAAQAVPDIAVPSPCRPVMPANARSLAMLQRSAGNAAVGSLLRGRAAPRPRPAPPMVSLQRRSPPHQAPAAPPMNAPATEHQVDGGGGAGPVDESVMVGEGVTAPPAPKQGEGGGDGQPTGAAVRAAATAERAMILADAAVSNAALTAQLSVAQRQLGAQVGAAKAVATSALAGATATSQAFFATKQAEVMAAATLAEQTATKEAVAMTATAQGHAMATYAQLNATAASASAGLQGRVAGFADQIVGAISGLSLPDLPGVSQLKSAATGLVRRAAGGVTAGIGSVQKLVAGALRAGVDAVSSMIGRASSFVTGIVRQIGSAIRAAAGAISRTLMSIASRISQALGRFLRGVVFPALDRLRAEASRHLVAGHRKATAAVRINTDYHLSMLDKMARLAPSGGTQQGGPAGAGAGEDPVATFQSIGKSARENNKLVVDLFSGRLGAVVSSIADMAKRGAVQIRERLSAAVSGLFSTVVGKVQEALQPFRAIAAAIGNFVQSILASVRAGLSGAIDWVRNAATQPVTELVSFGSNALGRARSFLGNLVRNVVSGNFSLPNLGIGAFRPSANSAGPVPTDAVQNSFGTSASGILGTIGTIGAVIAGIVLLPALIAAAFGLALVAIAALLIFAPLIALVAVLYGLYRLGKWLLTPSKLTITHETAFSAPGGAPKTRTEVGVGEKVRFKSNKDGVWEASEGSPKKGGLRSNIEWTAPDRAEAATISVDVKGEGKETVAFKVVEPSSITAKKESEIDYPAGEQGAGMILDFTYGPTSVSFGRVSAREVAGPASEVEGYYAEDGEKHFHQPKSQEFFQLGEDNRPAGGIRDRATQYGSTPPWKAGRFVWYIPNKFRVALEDGDGKEFTKTEQEFLMADETGKTTINKAGATVTRTP